MSPFPSPPAPAPAAVPSRGSPGRIAGAPRPGALLTLLALLLPAAAPTAAAAQERFTLEQVMSSPFPSELTAAPSAGLVAWVRNAEGVRNIWLAGPPDYRGAPLTGYEADDGQGIGDLRFTPDGTRLVYVRGGDSNRRGEHPNPLSRPEMPEQAIWVVGTDPDAPGEPRRLAEGDSPAVSPTGDRIAFLRDGQIWTVPIPGEDRAGSEAGQDAEARAEDGADRKGEARRLLEIRGRAGDLRWSPDGSRLAFASARGDHAFIGVYELESETLRYLDPGVDRDGEPVWSPDGRRIAFLRVPNERQRLPFSPRREALPFSIRVVDVATGEGRQVWRAEEGRGSAFQGVVAENQLLWGAGDRLVFPWERDGWLHLYSVPAAGGGATLLTRGELEVEHVTLTPDRSEVVYSSNQDDIDRRHLWRVSVTSGPPRAITAGTGIEWSPAVTSGGDAIAFLASSGRTPAHAAVVLGREDLHPLAPDPVPADFPEGELVEPEQVVYTAPDGVEVHAQLFLPQEAAPGADAEGRRPAAIFFHGGSRRQMLLGWHYRGYYHNAYALNQYLASRGYVVLAVNYRSGIGYGMEFREALDYGARGASEYRDVVGAGLWLRERDDVDPDRIGLWGGSYGGYLTALGLARDSDLFAAGVDLHGVHDWNVVIRNFVPSYQAEEREEFSRLAFESSPMADVDSWRSPVLLIHGDDDRNVPFSETVDLVESLRQRDVHFETLVFPDEVHGFLLHRNWLAAYRAAADFFDRTLMRRESAADEEGR